MVPVGQKDVQGSIGALAVLLIVAYQSPHFTLDVVRVQHFYDSFALASQICIRSDALALFGLREDELLPDLHITKAGVLRAELGAHQEHLVDHNQEADKNKVPAAVINVDPHEVASD